MISTLEIPVHKTTKSRLAQVDMNHLPFGKYISDHMLVADYRDGEWQAPEILPYGDLSMPPAMLALHYGQSVFEGMKAFRMANGKVSIFRIEKHYDRLCKSIERLCMPLLPQELFVEGLKKLVEVDADWVPSQEGSSLYLRPFVFASEERYGVGPSNEYKFIIFTGPVGPYYPQPLRVKVEDHYIRAARGGVGYAKCAGNYGGVLYPTQKAKEAGFDQVLWTDGSPELNIEESGTMNVMFLINNTLVTPPLSDTILDGVTRDSLLTIAQDLGYQVEERRISAFELKEAFEKGILKEAFGVGTAAVTAPIQTIHIKGVDYSVSDYNEQSFCNQLKKRLTAIRTGMEKDVYFWNTIIQK
ncbi:MAG: branched-chain amino acid aminotransferase [Saprospiraceae bacterium]|nr:branched-chain amino acid aminotransferase [Saprospiraceae bacterium]